MARTRHGDCEALRLRGVEPGNAGIVRTLLAPFDRIAPVERPQSWRKVRLRRWLHLLRRAALDAHPFGGLRAADGCRVKLLSYQLEPALAMLRDAATRVLIADDVGLGKTIQAGLILRELVARSDALRAIAVMPAGLRDQWREELRERFDLSAEVADAGWLALTSRRLPPDVNPWSLPGIYLASYDFVKRPEVLRAIEDVTWDVAVFDEAHAAALGTDRRASADAIATRARRVVLLTATPHGGDETEFEALCRLGRGADSAELVTFRRSRADAGPVPVRRTVLMTVAPTRAERRMHRLLERYASRVQREAGRVDSRAMLAAIVLRKRALSSAGSLLASATRRQALLAGRETVSAIQLALPLGDEDPLPDEVDDAALAAPGLIDAAREQRLLAAIVRTAREAAERETKTAFLLRFLGRLGEPVIVFTEYRDTLARLAAALERAGHRPLLLHGGLHPDERGDIRRAFNADGRILLATDAASEGLNLHLRCRVVVHYELPWSPVRLQQRTGRVDRIGQHRRVHELLLVAGDTAERLVLAPLARRVALASRRSALAPHLLDTITESRVAAAMLSSAALPLPLLHDPPGEVTPRSDDLAALARTEVQRLSERRRWRGQSSGGTRPVDPRNSRPVAVVAGRRWSALHSPQILVWRITMRDGDGHGIHEELVPVAVTRGASEDGVRRRLAWQLAPRLDGVAIAHRAVASALERRERAILSVLPAAARRIVQAGLFDRRALKDADRRGRAAEALAAESADRLSALEISMPLTTSFDLAAKLLVRRP